MLKLRLFHVFDLTSIIKINYKNNTLIKKFKLLNKRFDGFILAIDATKQTKILIEILKINAPIIVEKPLCLNKVEFKQILKYVKKEQIIFVNHYHLFSDSFKKFRESFHVSHVRNIFIQDGNFGPFRKKVHSIFDWGPHSIGVLFKLFNFKIQKLYYSKKLLNKNNDFEIAILKFLFVFSNGQKVLIKIGNGFKKRKSKISVVLKNGKRIIYENNIFYENKKLIHKNIPEPMENLLKEFHKSIIKIKSHDRTSYEIAKKIRNGVI